MIRFSNDFIVRKELEDSLIGLDSEEEFNNVMELFIKKHGKDMVP